MNYADACQMHGFVCGRCGDVHGIEMMSYEQPGHCEACGQVVEAEIAAERAADFRWLAKSWFTRDLILKTLAQCVDEQDAARKVA